MRFGRRIEPADVDLDQPHVGRQIERDVELRISQLLVPLVAGLQPLADQPRLAQQSDRFADHPAVETEGLRLGVGVVALDDLAQASP